MVGYFQGSGVSFFSSVLVYDSVPHTFSKCLLSTHPVWGAENTELNVVILNHLQVSWGDKSFIIHNT